MVPVLGPSDDMVAVIRHRVSTFTEAYKGVTWLVGFSVWGCKVGKIDYMICYLCVSIRL
ncbi:hypothetical protein ACFL0D_01835 [Thermoproteota archaeon]